MAFFLNVVWFHSPDMQGAERRRKEAGREESEWKAKEGGRAKE